MLITKKIASNIESCIKNSHLQFTRQHTNGAILNINQGAAFYSGDSFFTQVIGWGFETKENTVYSEVESIENFYLQNKFEQINIELSSLVDIAIFKCLSQRGYLISEVNNISVLDLSTIDENSFFSGSNIACKIIDNQDLHVWSECVALGFEYEAAKEQFYIFAQSDCVKAFGVFLDGKIVAGGTIAIYNRICDLGITSTLPQYRGKGLQKLLLNKRIQYAVSQKATMATVTTEPGSISDLNVQKCGFKLAYTRFKFTKSL